MTERAHTGKRTRPSVRKSPFLADEAEEGSESESESARRRKPRKSIPAVNHENSESESESSDSDNSFIVDDDYFE